MSYGGVITIAGEIYPKNIPYYYNPITLGYEVAQQAGGVGGGGDASAANQLLGNASLASIDTKLPALVAGRIPVVLPAGGAGLTDIELRATPVPVSLTGVAQDGTDISAPSPAMPAGGVGIRGWLSAIWTKLNASLVVTQATPANLQVTASAGTNLNTSTLATEATLGLIKAKTDNIPADPSREGGVLATAAKQDTEIVSLALIDTDLKAEIGTIDGRPSAYTVLDRLYQLGVKLDAQAKAGATEATMRKVLTALNKPAAPSTTTLLHR